VVREICPGIPSPYLVLWDNPKSYGEGKGHNQGHYFADEQLEKIEDRPAPEEKFKSVTLSVYLRSLKINSVTMLAIVLEQFA